MNAKTKPKQKQQRHPFFSGSYEEIGQRILATPADELVEFDKHDPKDDSWRALTLRVMVEQTDISAVTENKTPAGERIHRAITQDKFCSTFFKTAFEHYEHRIFDVIAIDVAHEFASGACYHELEKYTALLEAIITHFNTGYFVAWYEGEICAVQSGGLRKQRADLLRLLAAIACSHRDRERCIRTLLCIHQHQGYRADDPTKATFALMRNFRDLFNTKDLIGIASRKYLLPEFRAAAFARIADVDEPSENEEYRSNLNPRLQAALALITRFCEHPGNSFALHAVAWRAPRVINPELTEFFADTFESISNESFRHEDGPHTNTPCNMRLVIHGAAIWQFYKNAGEQFLHSFVLCDNCTFAQKFALFMQFSALQHCTPQLRRFVKKLFSDHEFLFDLMLMYSRDRMAGRPDFADVRRGLACFPHEVTRACKEEILWRIDQWDVEEGAAPSHAALVRFLEAAWGDTTPSQRMRKQLQSMRADLVRRPTSLDDEPLLSGAAKQLDALITRSIPTPPQ